MTIGARSFFGAGLLLTALTPVLCQQAQPETFHVGPGVLHPKLMYKVEPEYTPSAKADHVQGTVVLEMVVDERGRAVDISVISPLGYGLDEKAIEAVKKWVFQPGTKDGKPVRIAAIAEVSFRFQGLIFDSTAEDRRTHYNEAIAKLKSQRPVDRQRGVDAIGKLAKEHFPPAMDELAKLLLAGEMVPADPKQAVTLIQAAADANYGPAMYDLGTLYIQGKEVPASSEKAFKLMRDAAAIGSPDAQLHLGLQYESGSGVENDVEHAKRYFRLCAASGHAICQLHLGKLLLEGANRSEHDHVQAIAWLQLAGRSLPEARQMVAEESRTLSAEEMTTINRLRDKLSAK